MNKSCFKPEEYLMRKKSSDNNSKDFICKVCGAKINAEGGGTRHRNHCPHCLSSLHLDKEPGDRACQCHGIMDAVGVWVRHDGEWAIIHRCRTCGTFSSNRIAADDNELKLISLAVRPLALPPFPLNKLVAKLNYR